MSGHQTIENSVVPEEGLPEMVGGVPFFAERQVEKLLDFPGCIAAMKDAMRNMSAAGIEQPLRQIMAIEAGHLFGVMAGAMAQRQGYGAKLATVTADPQRLGRTRHQGIVISFDPDNGTVACMGDGESITRIRTAAMSAAATDVLAHADARILAIYGTGVQAFAHACAIAQVRALDRILIWGRSPVPATEFARKIENELSIPSRSVSDPREMASGADIICTVTGAQDPVLLGDWLRSGVHINLVGSSYLGKREVDDDLVAKSRFFVDSRRAVEAAGAEFVHALEAGRITPAHIVAEIGEVFANPAIGRTSPEEITVFKSLGQAVQDVAALNHVHRRWLRKDTIGFEPSLRFR